MVDLYADMFDLAPVSLWLEDFSELKKLFTYWRSQGITDLRGHLRAHPECVARCSRCIKVLRVNQRTLDLNGARDQQELTDNLHLLFRDDMLGAYVEELVQLWEGKLRLSNQTVNYTLPGERLVMLLNSSVLPGHEETWDRVLVALEDVTERDRAERHARSLFQHSPVALWVTDFSAVHALIDGLREEGITDIAGHVAAHPAFAERCMRAWRVIDVNGRTLAMFGAGDKEVLIAHIDQVFRDEMRAGFVEALVELSAGKLVHQREALTYTLQGQRVDVYVQFSVLPGGGRRWDQLLVSMTDITARKQAEAEVAYLSTHDALTGLYNRLFFGQQMKRLDEQINEGSACTLLVIDVNGLKEVNDSAGHPAGDALLAAAARLLEQAIEPPMTVSRIGGDEFAVLMPGADEAGAAPAMARLQDALAQGDDRPGRRGSLSLSIGAATRQTGETMEALLLRADLRMYEAKRAFYEAGGWDRRTR